MFKNFAYLRLRRYGNRNFFFKEFQSGITSGDKFNRRAPPKYIIPKKRLRRAMAKKP